MTDITNPLLISNTELDHIDESVIKDFITSNLDENYTVELKTYSKDKNFKYDIRKVIAAFANQQGGFLLIGIKDKKNSKTSTDTTERLVGHCLTEEPQKWIDDICGQDIIMPRPRYEAVPIVIEGKDILVVKVYAYPLSPIAIKDSSSGILEFWVRGNGSNLKMDYMTLSSRFQSQQTSLIVAAFIDLSDTFRDLEKNTDKPLNLNNLNPIQIVSSFVDDRKIYYGLTDSDQKIAVYTNNLRRVLTVINTIISVANDAHMNGKEVSNSDELSKQLLNWMSLASKETINIMANLYRIFPEIGQRYLDSLAREYNIDFSKFQ